MSDEGAKNNVLWVRQELGEERKVAGKTRGGGVVGEGGRGN